MRRSAGCRRCALLLACCLAALRAGVAELVESAAPIEDVVAESPAGVRLLYTGPAYQAFDRPLPQLVERTLLRNFEEYFNQTQEFQAQGANLYVPTGRQMVISITDGRVSGIMGDVYDASGRMLLEFSTSMTEPSPQSKQCKHIPRLATIIQKYGHMYYHFVQEVIPRIILLHPYLDKDTKVLTFGSAHEYKWLAELGISADQVEVYDPALEYCADELLVPSVSPIITPPKENYMLVRAAFHAEAPAPASSDKASIIYCSRRDATERTVENEADLLVAMRSQFPDAELYVFTGHESVQETIRLFQQATVVVGMHGAGLSHSVFSPPGTAIIEFLFMPDPPLMFWHAAAALGQRYLMLPLAQSWWLERSVHVPAQDLVDALHLAQGTRQGQCRLGYFPFAGDCMACPSGTYRPAGAASCVPCVSGRTADSEGSSFCSTCPAGTYSDDGLDCMPCASDMTTMFPGAWSAEQCQSPEDINDRLDDMFNTDVLTEKLLAMPAMQPEEQPQGLLAGLWRLLSPLHWLEQWRLRQRQHSYLEQLFTSDADMRGAPGAPSDASDGDEHHRSLQEGDGSGVFVTQSWGYRRRSMQLAYGTRRSTLGALGYGRRFLQFSSTYMARRRSMEALGSGGGSGYRRAMLLSSWGYRRQMQAGWGGYRRQLQDGWGGYRRQMQSGWGYRREMLVGHGSMARDSNSAVDLLSHLAHRLRRRLFTRASSLPGGHVVRARVLSAAAQERDGADAGWWGFFDRAVRAIGL